MFRDENQFEDKTLICRDCNDEFIFAAGEQKFYEEKGFTNEPMRCKICRDAKKQSKNRSEMFSTSCAACGKEARVPFEPKDNRPVYCSECYPKNSHR